MLVANAICTAASRSTSNSIARLQVGLASEDAPRLTYPADDEVVAGCLALEPLETYRKLGYDMTECLPGTSTFVVHDWENWEVMAKRFFDDLGVESQVL